MFDFRRITLFCLEKRVSKHKMAIFSKYFGGPWPLLLPPSVYALYMQYIFKSQAHTKLCVLTEHGRKKTQTSRSYHSCYQLQYV